MANFTFISHEENGGLRVNLDFDEIFLDKVLENFELFLKGCGYEFKGNLVFLEESPECNWEDDVTPEKCSVGCCK